MADSDQLQIILGGIVVRALDFDPDALSRFEQDAVRTDFDIEFIDLIGFERLALGMQVNRLPGPGCGGVEFSLRTAEPAAGQKGAPALGVELPQGSEPQYFPDRGGTV